MAKNSVEALKLRMQLLISKQNELSDEIRELQQAVQALGDEPLETTLHKEETIEAVVLPSAEAQPKARPTAIKKIKPDWEKFIGENLISKIGILITVIGVGIGSKYAIDHDMVSPLTRLILGYVVAGGLLGFALKLRKKYEAFSSVLLSGALAIMYFLTFAGYEFYSFFPKGPTFGAMVILTVGTVWAALKYSRPIIAHLGLVGSYAVPFLLSDGSGKPLYLFIYILIVNSGILFISAKRYWQSLYYSAFAFTWIILIAWFIDRYSEADFPMALTFLVLFFILFYATFLAYKLIHKKPFVKSDIFLVLSNSFTFYAIGFTLFSDVYYMEKLVGLYTLLNALLHFGVAALVRKVDRDNKKLYALIAGLGIVYITLTIPVQLEGGWITLLWAGEATLLFWIGRTKQTPVYEKLAYPLVFLSFFSLVFGWALRPEFWGDETPFINVHFLISLFYVATIVAINWLNQQYPQPNNRPWVAQLMKYSLPSVLLMAAYGSMAMEICAYWHQIPIDAALGANNIPEKLQQVWLTNYTLLFLAGLALLNIRKVRSNELMYANLTLVVIATWMTFYSLYLLSELRTIYLDGNHAGSLIWTRYTLYASVAVLVITIRPYFRKFIIKQEVQVALEMLFFGTVLWLASSELMHWLNLAGYPQSDKLALSILWGISSLGWVVLGIGQKKKPWRIGAIVLFGITLIKLFFYDISHLDTISKTIVLVALGILLLIISFLYNRYKQLIFGEEEDL